MEILCDPKILYPPHEAKKTINIVDANNIEKIFNFAGGDIIYLRQIQPCLQKA